MISATATRLARVIPKAALVGLLTAACDAADAQFVRGLNLNGPALTIDGRAWDGAGASNVTVTGRLFENQAVALKPATDPVRARMIRSSVWGSKVDLELSALPAGPYQVFLYVWEDNHNERFDLLVNERPVQEGFHSGQAGAWKKLGPWKTEAKDGRIKVSARGPSHGAANLSGLELWSGEGPVPTTASGSALVTHPTPDQIEFFERRIRPILANRCYECHSAGAKRIRGGLVLDSRAGVLRGGDTGPAVTPGDPEASLLIQAVRRVDPDLAMPPKQALSDLERADLESWVRQGVPDPRIENTVASAQARSAIDWDKARQWWSFRPVIPLAAPSVRQKRWPAGDLDRFILARIEREGLAPASDATRRTLLRRVTFDLTGLPPSPEEMDLFLADTSASAYARVVDRLLASPRYGERWGRHWLDVVRYADSAGDNSDFPIPQMHRYRDWVIAAFNRDLPYDQFVREQIAGDLLPGASLGETHDRVIATGYIANARRFGSRVDDYPQHLTIEDTLDNLGRAFLGLSVNCARCHDHKFDPISTADYYALYGIFQSTRYPWPGIELDQRQRDLVPLVEPGRQAAALASRGERDAEQRRLQKAVQQLKDSLKETPKQDLKAVESKIKEAERAAREFSLRPPPFEMAYAVGEAARGEDAVIQIKGDPAKPGEVVRRRFLQVLGGTELARTETGSGRRQLAEWMVDARNPLFARVMANRVWHHHIGRGLVPTPNDFGRQGKPPTHPELLDWLAQQLMESGWSIKSLHRLILLSRTYQMAGHRSEAAVAKDPNNELLAAFPRRRLDAEALRDTLLALGDNLDLAPAGPHPFPPEADWKFTQHNPFKAVYESRRRSVYLMTQRIQRHPYLAIFDGADPAASTPARTASTTPLQSLYLLNDPFLHEQAGRFAARILAFPGDETEHLQRAWTLALGRPADRAELERSRQFLSNARAQLRTGSDPAQDAESGAWTALARVIFRLNEFVYVD